MGKAVDVLSTEKKSSSFTAKNLREDNLFKDNNFRTIKETMLALSARSQTSSSPSNISLLPQLLHAVISCASSGLQAQHIMFENMCQEHC